MDLIEDLAKPLIPIIAPVREGLTIPAAKDCLMGMENWESSLYVMKSADDIWKVGAKAKATRKMLVKMRVATRVLMSPNLLVKMGTKK